MGILKKIGKVGGRIVRGMNPISNLGQRVVRGQNLKGAATGVLRDQAHTAAGAAVLGAGSLGAGALGAGAGGAGAAGAGGAGSILSKLPGIGKILQATGLGREGGLDLRHILGAAGVAAGAGQLRNSSQAHNRENKLLDSQMGIANEQAAHGRELLAGAKPIRMNAEAALMAALNKGRAPAPDMSGLVDTANPFRKKFRKPTLSLPRVA